MLEYLYNKCIGTLGNSAWRFLYFQLSKVTTWFLLISSESLCCRSTSITTWSISSFLHWSFSSNRATLGHVLQFCAELFEEFFHPVSFWVCTHLPICNRVENDCLNAAVFIASLFSVSLDAIDGHLRLTVAGTAGCTGTFGWSWTKYAQYEAEEKSCQGDCTSQSHVDSAKRIISTRKRKLTHRARWPVQPWSHWAVGSGSPVSIAAVFCWGCAELLDAVTVDVGFYSSIGLSCITYNFI